MAALWALFLPVVSGALPMLLLHMGLLVTSLCVLYVSHASSPQRWLFLVLPALPWIASIAGVIVKDVGMAYALLCAFACVYLMRTGAVWRRSLWGLLGMACIFYAFLVRGNAPFAVAPILYYGLRMCLPAQKRWQSFATACVMLALLLVGGHVLTVNVLRAQQTHPTLFMKADDISAVSVLVGKNLFDASSPVSQWPLERLHLQQSLDFAFIEALNIPYTVVEANWKNVIREYPWDFFKTRLHMWSLYFGLFPETYDDGTCPRSKYSPHVAPSLSERVFMQWVHFWRDMQVFFRPIIWLGLAVALYIFLWRREDVHALSIRLLCSSAIFYNVGYLLVTPGENFRFSYWPVVAVNVAVVLWLCDHAPQQAVGQEASATL